MKSGGGGIKLIHMAGNQMDEKATSIQLSENNGNRRSGRTVPYRNCR